MAHTQKIEMPGNPGLSRGNALGKTTPYRNGKKRLKQELVCPPKTQKSTDQRALIVESRK